MHTKSQHPSFYQFRALASGTRTLRILWPPVLSTVLPPAPQFLLLWIATVEDYLVLSFLALTVLELFKSQSPIGLALAPRAQSRLPLPLLHSVTLTPLYAKDYTTW